MSSSAPGARVTIRDVAKASGVSRSTVSFVLNETPGQAISEPTRARVRQAAADLGYVPHGIARALAEGISRIVLLAIEVSQEGNYSRSFIAGLDEELAAHGHVLLVRHGPRRYGEEQQLLDVVVPRAVLSFGAPYEEGAGLEDAGGGWRDGLAAHVAMQITYLVERGHTEIGLALPDGVTHRAEAHRQFAAQTAERLGVRPPEEVVIPRSRTGARNALRSTRDARPSMTAVAAFDDACAVGVLAAMADLGLRAPEDLAVIGYDETDYAALVTPALTTVHIDAEAHGRIVARATLGLPHDDLQLTPSRIVVRQTA
jgi:DNA-binding LacI/PurR family transcriptional regulator